MGRKVRQGCGERGNYFLLPLLRDVYKRQASTRASMSQKDTESYSAAKGALISLTHALAMSLAPLGVRVNSCLLYTSMGESQCRELEIVRMAV